MPLWPASRSRPRLVDLVLELCHLHREHNSLLRELLAVHGVQARTPATPARATRQPAHQSRPRPPRLRATKAQVRYQTRAGLEAHLLETLTRQQLPHRAAADDAVASVTHTPATPPPPSST